jgi:LuxR family maltose regulon positive regulatory protein
VGPSGSGKSVLLAQWAARHAGTVAALTIDPVAVDAVSVGHQLVQALRATQAPSGRSGTSQTGEADGTDTDEEAAPFGAEALRHLEAGGERMGAPFLDALVAELAGLPPTYLILDDAQVLPPPLVAELSQLVHRAPAQLHVVVSSQVDLALDVARLRARGDVTDVTSAELAFDGAGVAQVVERVAGVRLDHRQRARLHEATRGWPAGVQLAALALRGRSRADVDAYLDGFDGTEQAVADYLAEEVVARQPPELQDALRRTAVLDLFDAELCDLVTGDRDGGGTGGERLIRELDRRHLFVIPLDARQGWYRYHHLFADLLRLQLRSEDPELHDELLARAARWHLDHDDLPQAIEYLLRARRWEDALDAICGHGFDWFAMGESATALHWLGSVPAAERWHHRQANYTLIVLHRLVGNSAAANALVDEIERKRKQGERGRSGTRMNMAAGAAWDRPPELALADAQESVDVLRTPGSYDGSWPPLRTSEPDLDWALGAALNYGARALLYLDRYGEAIEWQRRCLDEAGHYPTRRIRGEGMLAWAKAEVGLLDAAEVHGTDGLAAAAAIAPLDPTSASEAHLGLGLVALERDELERADHHLAEAETLARVNRMTVFVATATAARARVDLGQGLPRQGLARIARHRRDDAPTVAEPVAARVAAAEANLLAEVGDLAGAKRALARAAHTNETFAVAARVALAQGDLATAQAVLDRWPASEGVRGELQRLLVAAQLAEATGDVDSSARHVDEAASLALAHGHRRVLLEGGPGLRHLLVRLTKAGESAALIDLGSQVALTAQHGTGPADDAGLSARELEVVACLAGPLSNRELAEHLGISANTLKTHLRSIYRKLGVARRRDAVERAAQLVGPPRPPSGATWSR